MPGVSSYDDGTPAGGGANSEGAPGATVNSVLKNTSAASSPFGAFPLIGGYYAIEVVATGFGSVTLQALGPDQVTWLNAATAVVANGITYAYLPQGQYRWTAAAVTGLYASISRIPVG